MKKFIIGIVILLVLIGVVWLVAQRRGTLRTGGDIIQRALQSESGEFTADVTKGAGAPAQRSDTLFVTDDDPWLGNREAGLLIVEFIDFQCPFCRKSFPIMRRLAARYPNDIFFQLRDYPLVSVHKEALLMAEAAGCAEAQGKFWEMHDRMFLEVERVSEAQVYTWAAQVGANAEQFRTCMQTHSRRPEIMKDVEVGELAGVRGTPTFFINGRRIEGVIPEDALDGLIKIARGEK